MAEFSTGHYARFRRAIRRFARREDLPIDYVKETVNDALEAIDTVFETNTEVRQAFSQAIDEATTPYRFSGKQKIALLEAWKEVSR